MPNIVKGRDFLGSMRYTPHNFPIKVKERRSMPIVDIEIVNPTEVIRDVLTHSIANDLGKTLGSSEGGTWVRVHTIEKNHYAENSPTPIDGWPIFVSILHRKLPSQATLALEIKEITDLLSKAFRRPKELIHVIYQPSASGRIAFGGTVVW